MPGLFTDLLEDFCRTDRKSFNISETYIRWSILEKENKTLLIEFLSEIFCEMEEGRGQKILSYVLLHREEESKIARKVYVING